VVESQNYRYTSFLFFGNMESPAKVVAEEENLHQEMVIMDERALVPVGAKIKYEYWLSILLTP
jgi:hypothetical protein